MSFDQFERVVCLLPLPAEPAKGSAVLEGMPGVVLTVRDECAYGHAPCYRVFFADRTERNHLTEDELAPAEAPPERDGVPVGCVAFFTGGCIGALITLVIVWLS